MLALHVHSGDWDNLNSQPEQSVWYLMTQGQVLLVEHVFHPYAPWGLPGGWIDRNESPSQTAVIRELQEELN